MRYRRPDHTSYDPHARRRGRITEGCLYWMLPVLIVLALVLYFAITLHPQGFPLIPWLLNLL